MYSPVSRCIPYMAKSKNKNNVKQNNNRASKKTSGASVLSLSKLSLRDSQMVVAPTSVGYRTNYRGASFRASSQGCRVSNCEYVGTVQSPATSAHFAMTPSFPNGIPLNPGLGGSFPWLSLLAAGFESYRVHNFRVVVKPLCPTSTAGSVYVLIDYDASDDDTLISKTSFMSGLGSSSGPIWAGCSLDYQQRNVVLPRYYLRNGGMLPGQTVTSFDVGTLYVALDGVSVGGSDLADIFFEYDVELFTPQINPRLTAGISQSIQIDAPSGAAGTWYPVDPANTYTSTPTIIAWPSQTSNAGSLRLQFNIPGNWLVEVFNSFISTSASPATQVVNLLQGAGSGAMLASTMVPSLPGSNAIASFAVRILEAGSMIAYVLADMLAKDRYTQVRISPYYYGYI